MAQARKELFERNLNTDGLSQTRQETSTSAEAERQSAEQVELLLEDDETSKPTEGACREVAREIKSGYEMVELVLLLERQK